jgi:hypothetical protein
MTSAVAALTMYNDQYFFIENPLNRYTLSQRNKLKKNEDGSIEVMAHGEISLSMLIQGKGPRERTSSEPVALMVHPRSLPSCNVNVKCSASGDVVAMTLN